MMACLARNKSPIFKLIKYTMVVFVQYTNNCAILITCEYVIHLLHVSTYYFIIRELPLCVLLSYIKIYVVCDIYTIYY
jgi:hypothetical protein